MAESDVAVAPLQPAQLTRRMIIGLGLAAPTLAVPWLAGCSSGGPEVDTPAITPSSASESSPALGATSRPSPTASKSDPSASEQALGALAAAILIGPQRKQLSKDRRTLLTFLRNAHTAHARAITNPLPSQAPVKLGGQSLNGALGMLARRETAAASRYRGTALQAEGLDALLWGSLSVASGSFATAIGAANPPRVRPIADQRPVEILSDVAAVQELVRQLHALVYGYQLAIGKMKVLSRQRSKAEQELLQQRIFRDRLITWLRRRSADVPAAEAAYVSSVVPRNPATAAKLIMQMQTALQPFCGLWLAAADGQADRQQALSALAAAGKAARSWGAPLTAWPGWSS
ncbi:MAG TPA: DUF4439 domain-containing protein [Propionibacteriaceae bacterium]|nr:DUF4439 domain-containing protein [Propionibacteriaceae bacterium]